MSKIALDCGRKSAKRRKKATSFWMKWGPSIIVRKLNSLAKIYGLNEIWTSIMVLFLSTLKKYAPMSWKSTISTISSTNFCASSTIWRPTTKIYADLSITSRLIMSFCQNISRESLNCTWSFSRYSMFWIKNIQSSSFSNSKSMNSLGCTSNDRKLKREGSF